MPCISQTRSAAGAIGQANSWWRSRVAGSPGSRPPSTSRRRQLHHQPLPDVAEAQTPGRGGDYLCFGQANAYGIGGGDAAYIGVANGNTTPGGNSSLLDASGTAAAIPGFYTVIAGIASTDTLKLRYFKTSSGTEHWTTRVLKVWPVRVI
jgi:hypothetical protein